LIPVRDPVGEGELALPVRKFKREVSAQDGLF
jgi:hypothetical protein